MADIFLSYSNENRDIAAKVARGFEENALSVWWDRNIHGGADFSAEIARQLSAARAAVVLWSRHSVESEWVRDEAGEARDAGKLVPACVDDTRPPLGFRQRQAINLARWNGDPAAAEFAGLIGSVRAILGEEPQQASFLPAASPSRSRALDKRVAIFIAVALFIAALGAFFVVRPGAQPKGVAVDAVRPSTDADAVFAEGFTAALRRELAKSGIETGSRRSRPEFRVAASAGREGERFVIDFAAENAEGRVLWSHRFRQGDTTPGEFQDFAASRSAGALVCALTKRDYTRARLDDEQFGLLIEICAAWKSDDTPARYAAATELVRSAPRLALAHAELAAAAGPMSMGARSDTERKRYVEQSRVAAEEALKIDPSYGLAHTVLGHIWRRRGDLVQAMAHWEKGLENYGGDHGPFMTMEWQLRELGRIDASIDVIERAMGHFPADPYFPASLAFAYSMKGWLNEAREAINRAEALDPTVDNAPSLLWDTLLAGTLDEARAAATALAVETRGDGSACLNAFVGAREAISAGSSHTGFLAKMRENCTSDFWQARMYAALGETDAAFATLQEFYATPEWRTRTILFGNEMRALHADGRFWTLANTLGLVDYWAAADRWPDFCADKRQPVDCKSLAATVMASAESPASP